MKRIILGNLLITGGSQKLNAGGVTYAPTGGAKCLKGQLPCPNNRDICYDPNVNYVVDPCKPITTTTTTTTTSTTNQAVEDYCQEQLRIALMATRFSNFIAKNNFIKQFLKNCRQNSKLIKYRVTLPNGYPVGSWLDKMMFGLNKNMPATKIAGYVWAIGVNEGAYQTGGPKGQPFQYINAIYGTSLDGSSENALTGYQIPLNYLEVVPFTNG